MIEIEGWMIRHDGQGNFLRQSREHPDCYMITIVSSYAIDIELLKEEIDKIPKTILKESLINIIKDSISKAPKLFQ